MDSGDAVAISDIELANDMELVDEKGCTKVPATLVESTPKSALDDVVNVEVRVLTDSEV